MTSTNRGLDLLTLDVNFYASEGGYLVSAETTHRSCAEPLLLTADEVMNLAASGEHFCRGHAQDEASAVKIGRVLYNRIFSNDIRDLFLEAKASARSSEVPVRLMLKFPPASEIQEVPWELLHDGDRFLALDPFTPVVRHIRLREPANDLAVEPPLRILFTAAQPSGVDSDDKDERRKLQLREEAQTIREAVAKSEGQLTLEVAEGGSFGRPLTFDRLQHLFQFARSRNCPFHLWHHAGHGRLGRGPEGPEFFLILEKDDGKPDPVPARHLSSWIAGGRDLKLALLNLCFSGSPTVGLSSQLARLNVPAVVGFQGAVVDPAALRFARRLYEVLPAMPLDVGLTYARHAMVDRQWPLEWSLPMLFSRSRERLDLLAAPTEEKAKSRPSGTRIRFGGGTIRAKRFAQIGRIQLGEGFEPGRDVEVDFDPKEVEADDILQIGSLETQSATQADFRGQFRELRESLSRAHGQGEEQR